MPLPALVLAALLLAALLFVLLRAGPEPAPGLDRPGGNQATAPSEPRPDAVVLEGERGTADRGAAPAQPRTDVAASASADRPRGSRVRGSVIDQDGNAVAQASVILDERVPPVFALADGGPQPARLQTKTDEQGRFLFASIPAGVDFDMWVHHPSYAPSPGVPVLGVAGEEQELYPVVLGKGFRIHGSVTDTAGNPLPAVVEVQMQVSRQRAAASPQELLEEDQAQGRYRSTQTDGAGRYELPLLAQGVWRLTARCEGYASAEVNPVVLMPNQDQGEQNLELGTEFVIGGVVVDEARNPVPGARVYVSRTRPRPALSTDATSGADGSFTVRGLQEGMYSLNCMAEGYSATNLPQVAAGKTDLELVMVQRGGVSGRVVDPRFQAVADFTVAVMRVSKGSTSFGFAHIERRFQDPGGNYRIDDLEPGPYMLLVTAPGFAPTYSSGFNVDREVLRGVDVQLKQGASVRAAILDRASGDPLPGAELVLHGVDYTEEGQFTLFGQVLGDPNNVPKQAARADAKGRVELRNAYLGDLKVEFRHPTHISEFLAIHLAEGQSVDLGTVQLRPGGSVAGVVLNADGRGVAGGTVYLNRNPDSGSFYSLNRTLDARGRFRFEGLRAGTYEVSAIPPDSGFLFDFGTGQTVYVEEGSETKVEIRLPPE